MLPKPTRLVAEQDQAAGRVHQTVGRLQGSRYLGLLVGDPCVYRPFGEPDVDPAGDGSALVILDRDGGTDLKNPSRDTKTHMSARPPGLLRTVHCRLLSPLEKGAIRLGVRSCHNLSLPDFLGIGAQKSGTRWLDANLRMHPDVYLPHEGELHYFDRDFHMPLPWYASKFETGREKLKGDITPAYGPLPPRRIEFIRNIIPEARLVLLLRNPVDRAWSQALMRLVSRRNRTFEDVPEREFLKLFDAPVLTKRGDYLSILSAWERAFSREQFYVGFFDDVLGNPRRLLTEVMEHLGLSTNVDWAKFPFQEVVHKGPGIPLPAQYREVLERKYRDDLEALYQRFGERVAEWRVAR